MREDETRGVSRRQFVIGTAGAAGTAVAGCVQERNGDGGDGGDGNGGDGGGGNGGDGGELSGQVIISGSSTVAPLSEAMAEEFQRQHDGINISVRSTGTGGGFSNHFCPGETQINGASRKIKEGEREQCQENDVDPLELRVATDALTVIVNNDADWVDTVTVEELEQIWGPDGAEKWSDVRDDWPDEEFELYGSASTSGTFDYFTEAIMGEEDAHREDYQPTENDSTIVTGVQGSKYAMGYFGFSYYYNNQDQVKALAIDDGDGGVKPSLETAAEGEYQPLSRPLFIYPDANQLDDETVAEFTRFYVENSTSQELVADSVGYVPLTEDQQQEQMDALESAIEDA